MREFYEWQAFDIIHGLPDRRADARQAITSSLIAALGGVKQAKPSDYIPQFDQATKQDSSEMKHSLEQWVQAQQRSQAAREARSK